MSNDDVKKTDSESIESLLFSGLLYRIINEPEDIRNSPLIFDLLVESDYSPDIETKIHSFESAMTKIERIKDKGGAYSTLESFLEGSRYNLIFIDINLHHIIHNKKSELIVNKLFDNGDPKKLKPKYLNLLSQAKDELEEKNLRVISIHNAIDEKYSLYLISNKHNHDKDRNFNVILIPEFENQEFHLQEALIQNYQLTNKESLVLTNLVSGCSVQQISEEFNISLNTVRSHLKSIYRKTNTSSQSDLIRLFLNQESHFLDSYFEPTKLALNLDIPSLSTDLFVTLSQGNKICYRDYGPRDGRPLIIFHNVFGSRFHIPYNYSETLEKTNRRIIIPEKPGYGRSDFVPNYYEQWNFMVNEFINKLEISNFTLLGNATGSASAVNFAVSHQDTLESVILTSPLFFNKADQNKLFGAFPATGSRLVSVSKHMADNAYRFWMKSLKFDSEKNIRKMIKKYAGRNEINCLEDQDFIDRLVLNFTESQRNNSLGSGHDAVCSLSPLNLDLTNITVPFHIWMGDEDSLISVPSAKEICQPIPNKIYHVREGYGEDIFYHLFEKIIQ